MKKQLLGIIFKPLTADRATLEVIRILFLSLNDHHLNVQMLNFLLTVLTLFVLATVLLKSDSTAHEEYLDEEYFD